MALKYLLTCVLMMFIEQDQAMKCTEVPGSLKQIDAGAGLVVGVNAEDGIFALFGKSWTRLPGSLSHVSVGPSGMWGANSGHLIFKLVGGTWVTVPGQLNQVDAGGDQFVVGVNHVDKVYCMERDYAVDFRSSGSPAPWSQLPGVLVYYSCGPIGCWGVNKNQDIYMREGVGPTECQGITDWQHIQGKLVMVEVGTDGSVYGVNAGGDVYQRDGVTECDPAGISWTLLSECGKSKHVSYDLGHLWVISPDDKIQDCVV
ncbi:fish-egg lectin-like [Anguilla anguilla]|nr:fish-egg lectin-like [Anguilla anguilla]